MAPSKQSYQLSRSAVITGITTTVFFHFCFILIVSFFLYCHDLDAVTATLPVFLTPPTIYYYYTIIASTNQLFLILYLTASQKVYLHTHTIMQESKHSRRPHESGFLSNQFCLFLFQLFLITNKATHHVNLHYYNQ